MSRVIVLAIDGLGTSMLGPYGNSFAPTPGFCRLANQSLLIEHGIVDSLSVESNYRSLLSGGHGCNSDNFFTHLRSIPAHLAEHNRESMLIIDSDSANDFAFPNEFSEQVSVELPQLDHAAKDVEETWLAHFFRKPWRSCRIQIRALPGFIAQECPEVGDAPYEFRLEFVDDDEPDPPSDINPSELRLNTSDDPDQLHGIHCAYGAQLMTLDMMLDVVQDGLQNQWKDTLFIVLGLRGYPLGIHGTIGLSEPKLQAEAIQIPMMLRFPESPICCRYQGLVQNADLHRTISSYLGLEGSPWGVDLQAVLQDLNVSSQPVAITKSEQQVSIRTQYWNGILQSDDRAALFVKPDDRWNVNNVNELCESHHADLLDYAKRVTTSSDIQYDLLKRIPESLLQPAE